jgi:hypothetical protein
MDIKSVYTDVVCAPFISHVSSRALHITLSSYATVNPYSCLFVRFQVLTAASIKMRAFWDIVPFSLFGVEVRTVSIVSVMNIFVPLKRLSTYSSP